ncbi:MAG: hypothetical protein KIT72_05790 [Polyangiaceae bacterium]|nr:hypothetical protein [Polyangiaceae bacterium]MCW5789912.1 hypothetical protein [Polyangiaceae bacterium]
MTEGGEQVAKKNSWLVPVLIGAGVLVMILIVLSSIAVSGFRAYLSRAKQAEALTYTRQLATAVIACSTEGLPPTTTPVPPTPPLGKYVSVASDWDQPAFKCNPSPLQLPQYFSYQWLRTSDNAGQVVAKADLNHDGAADCEVRVDVTCEPTGCSAAAPVVLCP